jgi:hypothetical protein
MVFGILEALGVAVAVGGSVRKGYNEKHLTPHLTQ